MRLIALGQRNHYQEIWIGAERGEQRLDVLEGRLSRADVDGQLARGHPGNASPHRGVDQGDVARQSPAIERITSWPTVEMSMSHCPGLSAPSTPSSANTTCSSA
jgi:hypothetical protein